MPKSKTRKHKKTHTPSKGCAKPANAYKAMDAMITMLGHTDAGGTLHSKISFATSDTDALQGLELVFRQTMTKAIQENNVTEFRKSYEAMERILGIDMENYEGLELHFPAAGKSLNASPSELCLAFKAWPIVSEIFKLSLAHTGPIIRQKIDSPSQLIYRLGSWLVDPDLQVNVAEITQLANEAVSLFLAEVQPIAKAKGIDMKHLIQGIPFLKQFPPLKQIFWTQYAALSV